MVPSKYNVLARQPVSVGQHRQIVGQHQQEPLCKVKSVARARARARVCVCVCGDMHARVHAGLSMSVD